MYLVHWSRALLIVVEVVRCSYLSVARSCHNPQSLEALHRSCPWREPPLLGVTDPPD